jgi:catechol 2,3-dioxygenase-like lactoylglutathione lyase family enzyme
MKYVHTNIISKDWKALAGFYIQVFQCKLLLPQRDLSGDWLSKGTGVKEAHIKGGHLRLPGYGKKGPTLEIFEYDKMEDPANPLPNRKGFGHLAFEVEDVNKVLEQVLALGGKAYGSVATKSIEGLGTLTFVYVQDPEGNMVELQNWGIVLSEKNTPAIEEEPVKLPKEEDEVLKVDSDKEDVVSDTPSSLNTENYSDLDAPISKRALLDELQNDLDASKHDLDATKEEVKYSKEDAKYQVQKTKANLKYDPDAALTIPKSKQELLAELKAEMKLSGNKKVELPKSKETPETPVVTTKKGPEIKLPPIPADLRVEFKKDKTVATLDLEELKLTMSSDKLAQNLWSFSNLTHPDNAEKTFLEHLGEAYRADLVPLKKHYKAEATDEENEMAWALTPRLKDSLKHFIGKCEAGINTLEELKLETINLSSKEWIETYKNLLILTLEVEAQGGTNIRLGYL